MFVQTSDSKRSETSIIDAHAELGLDGVKYRAAMKQNTRLAIGYISQGPSPSQMTQGDVDTKSLSSFLHVGFVA